MGTLSGNDINMANLRAAGFQDFRWGAPHSWNDNKIAYEKDFYDEDDHPWNVMYFPENFDGYVTPLHATQVPMAGKILVDNMCHNEKYVVVVDCIFDIEVAIQQCLAGKFNPITHRNHVSTLRTGRI